MSDLSVSQLLAIQLQGRFATASSSVEEVLRNAAHTDASATRQCAIVERSWLGRLPCSAADLVSAVRAVQAELTETTLAASGGQVGGAVGVANDVLRAYSAHEARLADLYDGVLSELGEVEANSLKVVCMISAGGAPYREFGLGDNLGRCVAAQVQLARDHGLVLDVVPVLFSDCDCNLPRFGVATGAVLLAMLRARARGQRRADGLFFACKGTLGAALATRAFAREQAGGAPLALVGFGTDLSQGFHNGAAVVASLVRCAVVFNSLQDSSIFGASADALEGFLEEVGRATRAPAGASDHKAEDEGRDAAEETKGEPNKGEKKVPAAAQSPSYRAVWVDADAHDPSVFGHRPPDHGWYSNGLFERAPAAPLTAQVWDHVAWVVGSNEGSRVRSSVKNSESGAVQMMEAPRLFTRSIPLVAVPRSHARVDEGVGGEEEEDRRPVGALQNWNRKHGSAPSVCGIQRSRACLRPVHTKVTTLGEFVGGSAMFLLD